MSNSTTKVKLSVVTPIGTYETGIRELTQDEINQIDVVIKNTCRDGSYFKLETDEGASVYLAEGVVKNSVFIVLTGDEVYA